MTTYDRLREEKLARLPVHERAMLNQMPDLPTIGTAGMRAGIEAHNRSMTVAPDVEVRDAEVELTQHAFEAAGKLRLLTEHMRSRLTHRQDSVENLARVADSLGGMCDPGRDAQR
ncbi:hypothetical protein ABGB18_40545 [Nonomuraea sp. B12E4]|uniref:hypothetical protein n=1 Tax=Nonomuraea sp. B12E4 TaxID=3153564 RepID=UPI00325D4AB5